ncbi:Peptide transporter PTR2A [Rhizoctonia solani]|uniref:Peptide transporter PTR2A n=1 Tax=Rhizoctonia solani TaxID=456999 RepID=A0A8H7H7V2_9AGAM|nr:Peptide transporter PTR2A [Rhizoctonia solani]
MVLRLRILSPIHLGPQGTCSPTLPPFINLTNLGFLFSPLSPRPLTLPLRATNPPRAIAMASEPHVDVDEVVALSKVQTIDEKRDLKHDYDQDSTDEVVDPSLLPTEEEKHTLRRVADTIPFAAWTIVFVEFAERFSWYGTTGPMTNYVQQPLPEGSRAGNTLKPDDVAGALGRGQRTSTALGNFRQFWTYFTPIIGAIVADTYYGRFKAICVFYTICLVGHILLVFVSIPQAIEHPNGALGGFIISLVIIGLGTGGFKSNISPLVAEQYRGKLHKRVLPSGETVLVDPSLTVQRTFLYFYMMINCGSLVSLTTTFAEKYVGFWLAYALPTFVFLLIPPVLVWGNKRYHKTPPRGSILVESFRVFRIAARGKWSINPVRLFKNFTSPDFWDSAKPSYYLNKRTGESGAGAGTVPSAITWDDEFADEVMRAMKACKVFAFFPLYWISYDQMTNNLTSQAATMKLNGVPNEIVNNLNPLSLVIMIPIMERIVYPALRRARINFTPIKRITFGFFLASLSMVYTTVIQYYIYKKGPCGKFASKCDDPAPLNVWLQAPSYVIIGLSEIFASITGLEYAFTKAPERMKSVVTSIFLFMSALASAIEFGLVGVSTDPYLMWMYAGVAITSFLAGIAFWFTFRSLDAEEDALNTIGATGRSGFKDEK